MPSGIDMIARTVECATLPEDMMDLFGDALDIDQRAFRLQEGFLIDYKQDILTSFAAGYGAGIVRLGLAFFNTYGGIIVFGVLDDDLSIVGCRPHFDIEAFNRFLREVSGKKIECLARAYDIADVEQPLQVVLVPRRGIEPPARLVDST